MDLAVAGPRVALDNHYARMEARWSVSERVEDYSTLVTPTGNASEPIHRWFKFKEAFSHALLRRILKDSEFVVGDQLAIYDPFAGSGTSLVSALEYARDCGVPAMVFGRELNPVMFSVASAKVGAAADPARALEAVQASLGEFYSVYRSSRGQGLRSPSPTLSNADYFSAAHVESLLALGAAARACADPLAREIFSTCVAGAVEPAGRIRKDGRALRFVADKIVRDPFETFRAALEQIRVDLSAWVPPGSSIVQVSRVDARGELTGSQVGAASMAIFSPPYPNNIDYTEVYKTEAWALGMYGSAVEMRAQRLRTLRSHPSVIFPESYWNAGRPHERVVEALTGPLIDCIPADRYAKGRAQVVRGYVDDMLQALIGVRRALEMSGLAAVVVGNSSHGHGEGAFVVASDLLIAALAEASGFDVVELRVARRPTRRPDTGGWLRESVVVLRAA